MVFPHQKEVDGYLKEHKGKQKKKHQKMASKQQEALEHPVNQWFEDKQPHEIFKKKKRIKEYRMQLIF